MLDSASFARMEKRAGQRVFSKVTIKRMCNVFMMGSIKITRIPYEEPYHLRLVMEACNGRYRGKFEFYTNTDDLRKLADVLEMFPRHSSSVHLWELGSERSEDAFAYYLRFRLFATINQCYIQIRFNNNRDLPEREIAEFCIVAEPTALNRLGRLIREFANLDHEVLLWTPADGRLFHTPEDANNT